MYRTLKYFGPFYNTGDGGGSGGGGNGDGGNGGGAGDGGNKDAAHWQSEAKKAFQDRDQVKAKLRELEGRLPSEEQLTKWKELETAAEQAEEERKKKAGEFDALLQQANKKHETALAAERAKQTEFEQREKKAITELHDTLVGLAFSAATEWFGPEGKTVLPSDVAQSHFGRYVEVQNEDGVRSIVVKDINGNPIINPKTGKPLPFAQAIGELVESWPQKDRLLRGSGKSGSGSSGGMGGNKPLDFAELTRRASAGDKDALQQLRQQSNAGGIVMGQAYQ